MPNKEYKNTKRTLITAIAILSIVMFVMPICAAIMKFQPSNNKNEQTANVTVTGFNLANAKYIKEADWGSVYALSDKIYDGNTNFIISNLTGLKAFAGIINSGNDGDWFRNNMKGKNIYLTADIDCGGANISIGRHVGIINYTFNGNFNGQHHTISNVTVNNYYYFGGKDASFPFYGFFTYSCGIIENLRLKNLTITKQSHMIQDEFVYRHAIVGFGEGVSIKNCVVETLKGSLSVAQGCGSAWTSKMQISLSSCYFDLTGTSISPGFISDSRATGNVVKGVSDGGYSQDYKNTAEQGQWVGLSNSSEGGNNDGQTYWYYGGDYYNDGWLYPRHFIAWRDVKIVAGSSALVEGKSEVTIQVPKDGNHVFDSSTATIKIYEQSVSSSAVNTCEHAKPMWIGSLSEYKVSYSKPTRTVEIVNSINSKQNKKISKTCCTGFIVNYTPLEKAGADSINIGGYVFTAPNGYYISNISEIETACGIISENKTITIQYEQKKYDISVS